MEKEELIFDVDDVPINTTLYSTENRDKLLSRYSNKVVASSVTGNFVESFDGVKELNQYLFSICSAFNDHKPLIISPDHLWLLICQGFGEHVNKNSWLLKFRLVNFFIGKKHIRVEMEDENGFLKDWEKIIEEVCLETSKMVKSNLYEQINLKFSTSTNVEQTAFRIAFMTSLSKYFYYESISICGYPKIKLKGTVEDYQKIIQSLKILQKFGLKWWTKPMINVMEEIVCTLKGKIDVDFWKRFFVYETAIHSGEKNKVTGWISYFFPYVKKKSSLRKNILVKNPYLFDKRNVRLELDNFTSGLSSVPLKVWSGNEVIDLNLISGFIGYKEEERTNFIIPQINWYIEKK